MNIDKANITIVSVPERYIEIHWLFSSDYLILFNRITDALEKIDLQDYDRAKEILIQAQQEAEEAFIKEE